MAFKESLTDFFNNSEFSKTALWNGQEIQVIFDNSYAQALGMAGSNPIITVIATDLAGAVSGDSIVIDAVTYTFSTVPEQDGTGLVRVELEKA